MCKHVAHGTSHEAFMADARIRAYDAGLDEGTYSLSALDCPEYGDKPAYIDSSVTSYMGSQRAEKNSSPQNGPETYVRPAMNNTLNKFGTRMGGA